MTTLHDKITNALNEMSAGDLLAINRKYNGEVNSDNDFYDMDEFNEIMNGVEPWEIARSAFYGDFRPCDKYFYFNGYGNLCSTDYPEDKIYIDDIADYIERNRNALYNDEIQAILDEDDENTDSDEE